MPSTLYDVASKTQPSINPISSMSTEPQKISDFILIGSYLEELKKLRMGDFSAYSNICSHLFKLFDQYGFPITQSVLEAGKSPVTIESFNSPEICKQIRSSITHVEAALFSEQKSKELIVRGNAEIPDKLTKLLLPNTEGRSSGYLSALRDDITLCHRAGSYRPAIVMSWVFGMELMRIWVFNYPAKLAAFNDLLKKRRKNSDPVHEYDCFFKIGDATFLEILRDGDGELKSFTTKTHRAAELLLDERNSCAHANYDHSNKQTALAYLTKLLGMLEEDPFGYKQSND